MCYFLLQFIAVPIFTLFPCYSATSPPFVWVQNNFWRIQQSWNSQSLVKWPSQCQIRIFNLQKIFSSSHCLLVFKHFPHTEMVRSIIHLTPPTERRLWENLSLTQGDCQKGNTGMSFLNLGGRVAKRSSFAKTVICVVSMSHSLLLLKPDWCDPAVWRCWVHASYPC